MKPRVAFVGAGPSDAGLLTVRGAELLARANAVLHDAGIDRSVLGLAAAAELREVLVGESEQAVASWLFERVRAGKRVVRLLREDALLFTRGEVEINALARHGAEVEIVPGVVGAIAAGAYAALPLSRLGDASPSVAFADVTEGHESLHDWSKLATATDALALRVDRASVLEIGRSLVFHGRSPESVTALVENVATSRQRVFTAKLSDLASAVLKVEGPRVLVILGGPPFAEALRWFSARPMFGKRVLLTRARAQAEEAASLFRERGAEPVIVPTIELFEPSDPAPMIEGMAKLSSYGWVALTSANGVERLFAELAKQGKDARAFGQAKIAAIGPGTERALADRGIVADVVAKEHRGEGLAKEILAAMGASRPRVLIARAEVARDVLPDALRAAGCEVDVVAVYETRPAAPDRMDELAGWLEAGRLDAVTLTSKSTVDALCDQLGGRAPALLANTKVACISPVTADAAVARGLRVDVVARTHTLAGLVEALEEAFSARGSPPLI